jgi:hypothetical protein
LPLTFRFGAMRLPMKENGSIEEWKQRHARRSVCKRRTYLTLLYLP